ncbi:hypothetical protein JI58_03890 [Marinosulfonomonas sp. PRT-SC04]|nr:hypothetical protein JI58_03890 [Marinosulfonomonas sp. PRT-SC04]
MIGLFLGLFILLFGLAILFNAAFSERAQIGAVIAGIGFLISSGSALQLIIALVKSWGAAG